MHAHHRMRQYHQQAVSTSSPEQLIAKLYDLGITACHRGDRAKLRAVLVELISSLNFERGGDLAPRLRAIYEYCLNESALGNLDDIRDLMIGLRDAWRQGVLERKAA